MSVPSDTQRPLRRGLQVTLSATAFLLLVAGASALIDSSGWRETSAVTRVIWQSAILVLIGGVLASAWNWWWARNPGPLQPWGGPEPTPYRTHRRRAARIDDGPAEQVTDSGRFSPRVLLRVLRRSITPVLLLLLLAGAAALLNWIGADTGALARMSWQLAVLWLALAFGYGSFRAWLVTTPSPWPALGGPEREWVMNPDSWWNQCKRYYRDTDWGYTTHDDEPERPQPSA